MKSLVADETWLAFSSSFLSTSIVLLDVPRQVFLILFIEPVSVAYAFYTALYNFPEMHEHGFIRASLINGGRTMETPQMKAWKDKETKSQTTGNQLCEQNLMFKNREH